MKTSNGQLSLLKVGTLQILEGSQKTAYTSFRFGLCTKNKRNRGGENINLIWFFRFGHAGTKRGRSFGSPFRVHKYLCVVFWSDGAFDSDRSGCIRR